VLGIGAGQVLGLVREARALERPRACVDVSGVGARAIADALAAGGAAGAVTVDGDPLRAAVAIRLLEDGPSVDDVALLRRLVREGRPVLVLRRGGETVPYVLPGDVLDAGPEELPIDQIADAIARAAPDAAPALAARLPVLRAVVERRAIRTTSLANAALAATPWIRDAHLPLLSLAQGRMLLLLGVCRGDTLPSDPQGLARAAGPAIAASVGLGLAGRELVRRLPVRGPLVRAAVAYAGTRALGSARLRLP
jgi:uncharacterized protein (DUF697 family)